MSFVLEFRILKLNFAATLRVIGKEADIEIKQHKTNSDTLKANSYPHQGQAPGFFPDNTCNE